MKNNLRTYRERRGLTQPELGERIGLSAVAICNIERGLKETVGSKWKLIAEVLDCSIDELLR